MNDLSLRACRLFLPRVLARACESTIPRSGERGARVNCFVVSIDKGDEPYVVVTSISGDELGCIQWNGRRYEVETTLDLQEIDSSKLRIVHYYGLAQITYLGIWGFVQGRLLPWPYVKIHLARHFEAFDQYFFNKRKLATKQRIELLRFLVSAALEGQDTFNEIDLMTKLYSIKWVMHPDSDAQRQKLAFYLASLVDTNELKKDGMNYRLTGHALRAIEEFEEEERKYRQSQRTQTRMVLLTFAIALLTVVQAGLVKLPVLLDLTVPFPWP